MENSPDKSNTYLQQILWTWLLEFFKHFSKCELLIWEFERIKAYHDHTLMQQRTNTCLVVGEVW